MKKLLLLLVFVLLLSSCANTVIPNKINAIDEINAAMSLPFKLTLPEKDLEYDDEYTMEPGFGCYVLRKDGLIIFVSGWPDVTDSYHVTEYRITGSDYGVFGISIGSALDDGVAVFESCGYTGDETEAGRRYDFRKNEQVSIALFADTEGFIDEIWLTAITTNKDDIVF